MDRARIVALSDFQQAHRAARIETLVANLTGKETELLDYDQVRRKLHAVESSGWELQEIPLAAIVGSVGRVTDFTRTFLPRSTSNQERWIGVKKLVEDMSGLPPIEVYRIGDAYFVLDGNHRVSVARQLGARLIQAYVKRVQTRVTFSPNDRPEDLIIKAELANFLEITQLDELRPDSSFMVQNPNQYTLLLQQIELVYFVLQVRSEEPVSFETAVLSWHDDLYLPILASIHTSGVMNDFPDHSETDLFIWLVEHTSEVGRELGWQLDPKSRLFSIFDALADENQSLLSRTWHILANVFSPDAIPVGHWRERKLALAPGRLIADVMILVDGSPTGWEALRIACQAAQQEAGRIRGLYLPEKNGDTGGEANIREMFDAICKEAGVEGQLAVTNGNLRQELVNRSRWVDLMVLPLVRKNAKPWRAHRSILERSIPPVLFVPEEFQLDQQPIACGALGYDGSPKSQEALFVAAYLGAFWGMELVVLSLSDFDDQAGEEPRSAQKYLEEHLLKARHVQFEGDAAQGLIEQAHINGAKMIIIGSHHPGTRWPFSNSRTLENLLARADLPVLVCH